MKPGNFLRILALALALSGYSAWSLAERDRENPADLEPRSLPVADIPLIRLAEAKALWEAPSTVFLDVRSPTDFPYGHIQGAIHLPYEEFDERFPSLKARLEQAKAIVVYCKSTDCGKSYWCALRLRQEGLAQTKIYPEGWYEWKEHGLPSTATADR